MMETAITWIHAYEYPAIVVLLMLGIVGLPIPDETLLVFVGYLCFKGTLSIPLSMLSAVLETACGITISYHLGQFMRSRLTTTLGPWLRIDEAHFHAAQRWISRWGKYAIFVAYFVPGLRHLSALAGGASGLRYFTFATFAYAGAFMWSASFITTGYLLAEEWSTSSAALHQALTWIGVGTVLVVITLAILIRFHRSPTNL